MKLDFESFSNNQELWELLEYKPQWSLTWKGWVILSSILFIVGLILIRTIQPFLAMCKPIEADALVVEGWIGDIVSQAALEEFEKGHYQVIITTGSTLLHGSFLSLSQYKNYAEMAAATLVTLGVPESKIISIPNPIAQKDRTATSAEAVKDCLSMSNLEIKALNIYSYDVHTRRSWYIYKKVLGEQIKVGAIAYPGDYNPQMWWTSSSGVKSVFSETIAYLYTRFFWKN